MRKARDSKIRLSRETIKVLQATELSRAHGGVWTVPTLDSCPTMGLCTTSRSTVYSKCANECPSIVV
jgi:hypothetical protein